MDPDDVNIDGLLASPLPHRSRGPVHLANDRKAKVCRKLLRSRLEAIEVMEAKLENIAKYSVEPLNEHDELAMVLAHEIEESARLAATLGIPVGEPGYMKSYAVVLHQCREVLLDHG
ncbi:unnamed protein product [Phytophthora fragariaefolia]|uniref:Unnamed protein product n=1 Tax=Phytophthora fragariaefolia TaxID=1490495 RepID=A0A9W7CYS1_9STRA|nr:unnamed protein product [Phytophthora fragariaefolia]